MVSRAKGALLATEGGDRPQIGAGLKRTFLQLSHPYFIDMKTRVEEVEFGEKRPMRGDRKAKKIV